MLFPIPRPGFRSVAIPCVVVSVGRFHDGKVGPVAWGEVGVLDQAASMVLDVSGIGCSFKHAVDDAYYFGPGDDGIGSEGPVAVAADPAGSI